MGPLVLALLVGTAFADESSASDAPIRFGPSFGFEGVVNDPFLYRNGARFGVNVAPVRWAEVGTALAYYPIFGRGGESDPDWKPLARQRLHEYGGNAAFPKLEWQWQTVARVHAIRLLLGETWYAGVGMVAGVTVVSTRDEVRAFGSAIVDASPSQVRVGPVVGVFWEARRDRVTLRMRYELDAYVETYYGDFLELKKNAVLGAELLWWFG